MTSWNIADIFEAVAQRVGDHAAQIHGNRTITWAEFDRRANALAHDLLRHGLNHQAKVAAYLYNGPEYLETYFAAFKAGLSPVNTNYRYGDDEIVYLFDNADAEAVVFHAVFTPLLERVRARLPRIRRWIAVPDESGHGPEWAAKYDELVDDPVGPQRAVAPWGRSPDDLLLLYTGGTTGMPKGVMWRQVDLFNVLGAGGNIMLGTPPKADVQEITQSIDPSATGMRLLSACPLMHGTGQFTALLTLAMGGTVVTLASRRFDVKELLREVQDRKVNTMVIVGQAFAGPMLEELDAEPTRYDLSSLFMVTSSGVMWSQDNKDGLLRHLPGVILFDSFGSSEAVGLGASVSTKDNSQTTAKFQLGATCAVFTEDGRRVAPGSNERGMVAVSGFIPMGYYKDEAKSAQTFRVFEDRRWSVPGDWAEVNADGTLHLLGRGSVCINTGGEKVFPEEVEEALKTHPGVRDAVCVGVPDPRFGEAICAVIEPEPDTDLGGVDLAGHVKLTLAAYKAPRQFVVVDTIGRAPNGKVDYKAVKALATERLAE